MSVRLKARSRLQFSPLLVLDGREEWDLPERPPIVPQSDDAQYTVMQGDRIDRLAKRFYGEELLWWVLADANNMEILPIDLHEGAVIRVPSPRYIIEEYFRQVAL